jgi:hypothetical protein
LVYFLSKKLELFDKETEDDLETPGVETQSQN